MPHGFETVMDDRDLIEFRKTHKNGDVTRVKADKIGTQATGGTKWLAHVVDPNGSQRLGRFETKREAKKVLKRWMKDNPKGVQKSGALGTLGAMNEGAGSIFTGGGKF